MSVSDIIKIDIPCTESSGQKSFRIFENYYSDIELVKILNIIQDLLSAPSYWDIGNLLFKGLQELEYNSEAGCKLGVYYKEKDIYEIVYYSHHTNTPLNDRQSKLNEVKYFSKIAIDSKKIVNITNSHSTYALGVLSDLINTPAKTMLFVPLFHKDNFIGLFSYSRSGVNSIGNKLIDTLKYLSFYLSYIILIKLEIKDRLNELDKYAVLVSQKDSLINQLKGKNSEYIQNLLEEVRNHEATTEKLKEKVRLFNSLPEGVLILDNEKIIRAYNQTAENIIGKSLMNIIGKKYSDALKSRNGFNLFEEKLNSKKNIENVNSRISINHGHSKYVSFSSCPFYNAEGIKNGWIISIRDLSRTGDLQNEILKSNIFEGMVSKNPAMLEIFNKVIGLEESESPVLIEGATGTGKDLLARAIHKYSPRKDKQFIILNCSAINKNLMESELYGYVKGAFTDAKEGRKGKILLSDGGTLFLDEIAEIPFDLQSKLLRFIENLEIEPVGSDKSIKVNTRIIAATNRVLNDMMDKEEFRDDLYYRLNVINFRLPALNERKEDIPLLIDHFIKRFNNLKNKNISGLSPEAMGLLSDYNYPGNIRELEMIIESASDVSKDNIIEIEHLPARVIKNAPFESKSGKVYKEKKALLKILNKYDWKIEKTAETLGISRMSLWRKMKKFNLLRERRKK